MLDQDCNPKLFDFSSISGGIFPDKRSQFVTGTAGYLGLLISLKMFLFIFDGVRKENARGYNDAKEVTVKMWEHPLAYPCYRGDNHCRFIVCF
ncbi:hypothetical protein LguiA_022528 [Lonicera macranthoides]